MPNAADDRAFYHHRATSGPFAYGVPQEEPERRGRHDLPPSLWLVEPLTLADLPGGLAAINDCRMTNA